MYNQQNMKVKIDNIFETICPFPIGYVYMSSNSTSPADIYGGTWSGITSGKYIRANNSWDNGGSNTITTSQMPAHSHLTSSNVIVDVGHWGTEDKGVIPQHAAVAGVNTPFGNRPIGTTNTGGATVLSNISKRVCLVQNSLARKQVIAHA